jgi:hypothetical protein
MEQSHVLEFSETVTSFRWEEVGMLYIYCIFWRTDDAASATLGVFNYIVNPHTHKLMELWQQTFVLSPPEMNTLSRQGV